MAQTGYTPISLYYSTTASAAPTAGNLVNGELAINITDKKLYAKDNSGNVFVIADASSGGTTATNLSGGSAGSVPYQSGASTTTFLSLGTAAQVLQVNAGATAPEWVSSTGTGNVVRAASPTLTGTVAGASLQLSSLTSGRVTYAGASGLLQDSANLLYSGTDLTVYGITVGRGAGAVASNTAVGASALAANTTGSLNTAVGASALAAVSTAANNTAVGYQAALNTTGASNTAIGQAALLTNTTGAVNVAVGSQAMYSNLGGGNNTALGALALYSNTSGGNQVAVGRQALYSNSTGGSSVALGYQSQFYQTGGSNDSLGLNALRGASGTSTGTLSVAIGRESLYSSTSGYSNTALGYQAGYAVTTGGQSTFLGYLSGSAITTGSHNVILGSYTGNSGGLDIRTASNYIVLSDGQANIRQFYDGGSNYWAWLTGASERMRIDSSGNVGIGTASPTYKLDVDGPIRSSGTGGVSYYLNDTRAIRNLGGAGSTTYLDLGTVNFRDGNGAATGVQMNVYGNGYFAGNVGIGTASPSYRLDVSTASTAVARFTGPANAYVDVTDGTGYLRLQLLSNVPHIGSYTNHNLNFITNNSVKATISTAGNLGIGTSSPTNTLGWGYAIDMVGTVGSPGAIIYMRNPSNAAAYGYVGFYSSAVRLWNNYPGVVAIGTDNTERLSITSTGDVLVTSTGGLGYGTGSGGAVTQTTSRTTGVTLDKTNGAITLVSAAGTATWQSFTVTNNKVAATDVVKVCQKSGTDLYMIHVTAVAAGSFRITFATTGGTTTEQPVFNFAVIKAVTS